MTTSKNQCNNTSVLAFCPSRKAKLHRGVTLPQTKASIFCASEITIGSGLASALMNGTVTLP